MLRKFASFNPNPIRRFVLTGAIALAAAAGYFASAAPTLAFSRGGDIRPHMSMGGSSHSGNFRPHMNMGGFNDGSRHSFAGEFRHDRDPDFGRRHRRFRHDFDRFAFAGPDFFAGNYDYTDDGCFRRLWGPYGWHWVNVCY
jgi:hypothetical protein